MSQAFSKTAVRGKRAEEMGSLLSCCCKNSFSLASYLAVDLTSRQGSMDVGRWIISIVLTLFRLWKSMPEVDNSDESPWDINDSCRIKDIESRNRTFEKTQAPSSICKHSGVGIGTNRV